MALNIKFKKGGIKKFRVYTFGHTNEGSADMKDVLGGKGANLAEMGKLGIPVPSGFTIPCETSIRYTKAAALPNSLESFMNRLWVAVDSGLEYLNTVFEGEPVLLSVRSGARVSMPGMMDTILNVGLTSETLPHWKEKLGDRAALDSYRRLIQMYSSVALGLSMEKFEDELYNVKAEAGVTEDTDLTAASLSELVDRYLRIVKGYGKEFPDTLEGQLEGAIVAVFKSWDNPRAKHYRKMHGYSEDWGTAVNVQAMVFGNAGEDSATGVLFSRCPSTGADHIVGEFLENAQGEDVVAGIRTPRPLAEMEQWNPDLYAELRTYVQRLEDHYKDLQDIEFTVERGQLYILQTRNGKRGPMAAFKVAHDMAVENRISWDDAVKRVTTEQLTYLMKDRIDPAFTTPEHFSGIAAGGGLVAGVAKFTSDGAVNCKEPCILVRDETSPDDIAGMNAAVGILTATGGLTSHAAVVARGLNKTCVVGCTNLTIINDTATSAGLPNIVDGVTKLTMDGETGRVWIDVDVPVISGGLPKEAQRILDYALGSKTGHISRLVWAPTQPIKESQKALQEQSHEVLYVDTAPTEYVKDGKPHDVLEGMEYLRKLLESADRSYVIDLHSHKDIRNPIDGIFDKMFGSEMVDNEGYLVCKVTALSQWPEELVNRITLKIPDYANGGMRKDLQAAGYALASTVETVADLLNAKGPVKVSEHIMETVFGSVEAYEKLKGLLGLDEGEDVEADSQPLYWFEVLEETA